MLVAKVSWFLSGSTSLPRLPIPYWLGPPPTILRTFFPSWRAWCSWPSLNSSEAVCSAEQGAS